MVLLVTWNMFDKLLHEVNSTRFFYTFSGALTGSAWSDFAVEAKS